MIYLVEDKTRTRMTAIKKSLKKIVIKLYLSGDYRGVINKNKQ